MRQALLCAAAALVLSLPSCRSGIQPVTGKVTYQGAPTPGACVYFLRTGGDPMNDPTITGIVQEDGSFELVCGGMGKGAPPGEYDVLIEWKRGLPDNSGAARDCCDSKCRRERGPDKLAGRYADRDHPLLHARIDMASTTLPTFALDD